MNALYAKLLEYENMVANQSWHQDLAIPNYVEPYRHYLPFGSVIVYLLMVFLLPKLLQLSSNAKAKPSKFLTYLNAGWNLFLTVGSAVMLFGFLPHFLKAMERKGPMGMICDTEHDLFDNTNIKFWVNMFILSKYAELVDTLFLIVKNPFRAVPFLHYYHHATVLLFCWYCVGYYRFGVGFWFGMINASVHTIMYFYYFLAELGYRPSWAFLITIIQISQMVAGIGLNITWAVQWFKGENCECTGPRKVLVFTLVMYGSYLYLFVQFFKKRYFSGPPAPRGTKADVKKE